MTWLTIISAVFLILSSLSPFVSPVKIWFIAIFGLLYPYLFILNFFLFLFFVSRKKLVLLVPLMALIISSTHLPLTLQLDGSNGKPEDVSVEDEIKLVSFNVRVFDLYNWSRNIDTRERIFSYIENQKPNLLCLQEFYSSDKGDYNNLKLILSRIEPKYKHVEYSTTLRETDHWGIATFSSYPIFNKGVIYFDEQRSNVCIFSDITIKDDTVRVYNSHLQSIRFDNDDYKFIESFVGEEEEPEKMIRTKAIVSRLKLAYIKRAKQAEMIAQHIETSPYPVVICGDFNDTPVSYSYRTISNELTDAFKLSGMGIGSSYSGPIPGLRIDYILHSSSINSYDFEVDNQKLSDHYPITCKISFK